MGDVNTASTLVFVAAILQIIISILSMVTGVFSTLMFLSFMLDPLIIAIIGPMLFFSLVFNVVMGVVGIIFSLLWLKWRHYPNEHKTGLIVSGILGLLFGGFIPGLLALIGGAIAPSPSEYPSFEPAKTVPFKTERRCSSCGAEATGDDKFCWRCGAVL